MFRPWHQTRSDQALAIHKSGLPLILVFGGPSSGKAMLCRLIAERYGYTHISAGQVLREEAKRETARGRRCRLNVDAGHLCDPGDVHEVIRQHIYENIGRQKPIIVHGYPRDPQQRTAWETDLGRASLVIFLECSDVVMADRTATRSKKGTRPEDQPEIVHKRIQYYVKYTVPMLKDIQLHQLVMKIDGDQDIEQVYEAARKLLDIHIK